jgi:lipopolysaccharide/colanic/teichoic acid biosynthesis glycosyltransferase
MTMLDGALELGASPAAPLGIEALTGAPLAKRIIDVVGATALLLIAAPVVLAVALAVWLGSEGPVLFRQRRVGRGGVEFEVLKFRTMHRDAERQLQASAELHRRYLAGGCKLPPGRDPRVTRVGALLRRLDLDELPQLWNVLRGDMSLVGPRPVPETELHAYGHFRRYYEAVRPGLTGLWQVSGRNRLAYRDRVALDVDYVQRLSVGRDLAILLRTLPAMVRGGGAPEAGLAADTALF